MSQDNELNPPAGPDRSRPRYQPPAAGPVKALPGLPPGEWPPVAPWEPGQGAWNSYQPGTPVRPAPGVKNPRYSYPSSGAGSRFGGYNPPGATPLPSDPYQQAVKRVEAKMVFFKHLTTYLVVNGFLWAIALLTTASYSSWSARFWPVWITVFWGIGLASQWWKVFGPGERYRQQMIEEELRRLGGPRP